MVGISSSVEATYTIVGSTISNNHATSGGGVGAGGGFIDNGGAIVMLSNSTITGNTASGAVIFLSDPPAAARVGADVLDLDLERTSGRGVAVPGDTIPEERLWTDSSRVCRHPVPRPNRVTAKGWHPPRRAIRAHAPTVETPPDVVEIEIQGVADRHERERAVRLIGREPGVDFREQATRSDAVDAGQPMEGPDGILEDGEL